MPMDFGYCWCPAGDAQRPPFAVAKSLPPPPLIVGTPAGPSQQWLGDETKGIYGGSLYISGGENVYPREIEEFLFRHPKVQSVQVFGVPDVKYGEEICAWVVLKPGQDCTEDDIRDYCRDQIAHYKVPRYIRFVSGFPMTVTGKIQKFKIRDEMKNQLGLEEDKTA